MLHDPQVWFRLISQHLSWYPLMELRDVYKLLYQGVMGSEHLLSSQEDFSRYLHAEFDRLLPDPLQRLLEPVRPDQMLFRLNLRAYKGQGSSIDRLIPPFLETSRNSYGGIQELPTVWMNFVDFCTSGLKTDFKSVDLHNFTSWLEKSNFPAVHHSQTYRIQYQPAYRLIAGQFVNQLGLNHAG